MLLEERRFTFKTDIQVQLVAVNRDYIAVSSGRHVVVYKISARELHNITALTSFSCDTEKLLIHSNILIVLTPQVSKTIK
jgi:hypothetical protein